MNDLDRAVYNHVRGSGYRWCVPEVGYKDWYADFIAWGPGKGVLEIETKRTFTDYVADKRKKSNDRRRRRQWNPEPRLRGRYRVYDLLPPLTKWEWLLGLWPCQWRPTNFVIAAPWELATQIVKDKNYPSCFGIWGNSVNTLQVIRRSTRLCRLRPEQQGRFERDIMKRAVNFLDNYYSNLASRERIKAANHA